MTTAKTICVNVNRRNTQPYQPPDTIEVVLLAKGKAAAYIADADGGSNVLDIAPDDEDLSGMTQRLYDYGNVSTAAALLARAILHACTGSTTHWPQFLHEVVAKQSPRRWWSITVGEVRAFVQEQGENLLAEAKGLTAKYSPDNFMGEGQEICAEANASTRKIPARQLHGKKGKGVNRNEHKKKLFPK